MDIDKSVVNLLKGIKTHESGGNYSLPGASGEYGAYQFTPDTFKGYAQESGMQNANLSNPADQDKVAYMKVKKWKDEGYKPEQILSMWNAGPGEPNAYMGTFENGKHAGRPSSGINDYGVQYSVPNYVNSVKNIVNKQKIEAGGGNPTNTQKPVSQDNSNSTEGLTGYQAWKHATENDPQLAKFDKTMGTIGTVLGIGGAGAIAGGPILAALGVTSAGGAAAAGEAATGGGLLSKAGDLGKGLLKKLGVPVTAAEGIDLLKGNKAPEVNVSTDESSILQKISQLESEIPQAQEQSKQVREGLMQELNTTTTGRKMTQDPLFQEGLNTMSTHGLVPDQSEGFNNSTGSLQKTNHLMKEIDDLQHEVLKLEGGKINVSSLEHSGHKRIDEDAPMHERTAAHNAWTKNIGEYKKHADKHGNISIAQVHTIRGEMGRAAKDFRNPIASAQRHAFRAGSRAARHLVESNVKNKELYNITQKEKEKLIHAEKILKHLHGKKAHTGHSYIKEMMRGLAKYASIGVGDKIGGPMGAIIGSMIGTHLDKAIDKKFGKTLFESPAMKIAIEKLENNHPAVAHLLIRELKQRGIEIETKKRMDEKRVAYYAKKKGVLEPQGKTGEYESYKKEGLIRMGKKPVKKVSKEKVIQF